MTAQITIASLRRLFESQEFDALKAGAETLWSNTGDVSALPLLALALLNKGETEAAQPIIAQAEAASLPPDAQCDLAAAQIRLGRLSEAESLLLMVLMQRPGSDLALARLGWLYMQTGRLDDAARQFELALLKNPMRILARLNLVRIALRQGQSDRAHAHLDDARQIPLLPNSTENASTDRQSQLDALQLEILRSSGDHDSADAWLTAEAEACTDEAKAVKLYQAQAFGLAARNDHAGAEAVLTAALGRFPDAIPLMLQRAGIAQVHGRTGQAIATLKRALKVLRSRDETDTGAEADILTRLAIISAQATPEAARRSVEKALEMLADRPIGEPLHAAAICALADIDTANGREAEAETRFRQVLDACPNLLQALQGLGRLLLQTGELDEAVALFQRLAEIDPATGHAALISARHFPKDEAALERLETIARQPCLEGGLRSGLMFQVAAAWEKRKDYDRAWACVSEANQSVRRHLRYDRKDHRNMSARIRQAFSKALFDHRQAFGLNTEVPVFVVGMPRSGTTLVEQILAGHSRVAGAGELGLMPSRAKSLGRWERRIGSGRSYPECIDDLTPEVTKGIAAKVLEEMQEMAPEADRIIDKLPHNFENIGLIRFLFPKARIISVRRDPRDIAISNYFTDYQAKHGGMGFAYDLTEIGEQLADHNLLMHHWAQVFPDLLEVRYEDLIADPEGQARRMVDYLGLDLQEAVLDHASVDRSVRTASVWQVRQSIYQSSREKWRQYEAHLAPLIAGTNAPIRPDVQSFPVLPFAGLLDKAVAHLGTGDLDAAELAAGKLLHHLPQHAAAHVVLAQVWARKGLKQEAREAVAKAVAICPQRKDWRRLLDAVA